MSLNFLSAKNVMIWTCLFFLGFFHFLIVDIFSLLWGMWLSIGIGWRRLFSLPQHEFAPAWLGLLLGSRGLVMELARSFCSAEDITWLSRLAVDIIQDPLALPLCTSLPSCALPCSLLPPHAPHASCLDLAVALDPLLGPQCPFIL